MDRLSCISSTISRKNLELSSALEIVEPDKSTLSANLQADWLIRLLNLVYTEHGITKRREGLVKDIQNGDCRVWFATESNQPVASAALVKQSDQAVEIGRAVSLKNGVGGLLMLMAAFEHLSNSEEPLIAEVRIADQFKGVPSGEATQVICLKNMGLIPHASVPAFNHGDPIRQETFLFSSSSKLKSSEPVVLPDDKASLDLLLNTAVALAASRFGSNMRLTQGSSAQLNQGWEQVSSNPFSVLVPNGSCNLETTLRHSEKQSALTLVPVETSSESSSAIIECLNSGFVPCGFDRNVGKDGHPVLLLGKLRTTTLLAPIKLLDGIFLQNEVAAINKIDREFRKSLNN